MDYWNHVVWSDETKINLFGSDGVKRVWRQPGEEYKDKCVLPTVKHGGGSVMVWGCMVQQLRDVIMEEWKRTPVATCEALVNSMPKRVKAVLENNGGHTNIDTLGPIWTFSLRGVLTFVASGLDINGCVLSYFEGTANLHCYTSCTLTTLHCSKVSFVTWKYIIKYLQKCEGCTHFCEILYIQYMY